LYEILCLFIKFLWKTVLEFLDFLPGQKVRQTLESKTTGDKLIDDAT